MNSRWKQKAVGSRQNEEGVKEVTLFRSWFKREAVWTLTFHLVPAAIGLAILLALVILRLWR